MLEREKYVKVLVAALFSTFRLDYEPMHPNSMCNGVPRYIRKNTNLKCSDNISEMQIYYNASLRAIYDCQKRFEMRPWNCTSNPFYISRLVLHSFPETSYLYAVHSAALAHSFMYACASGRKSGCSCTPQLSDRWYNRGSHIHVEEFICSDTFVRYGVDFSRKLLENNEESDSRWLIDNHNKEAGRQALLSKELPKRDLCRCQGISGACSVKKCIRRLPNFSPIGKIIMEKYFSAVKVSSDNLGKELLPFMESMKPPTSIDLVYAEDSPSFCEHNKHYGSVGTKGRECDKSGHGPNACYILCCDRGYDVQKRNTTKKCNCTFAYCCSVKCDICNRTITTYTCK